jgi:hypothetical protein
MRPRVQQYERTGLYPEEVLAATVVKGALRVFGPKYALSPAGRFWLGLMGLDSEAVYEKARGRAG